MFRFVPSLMITYFFFSGQVVVDNHCQFAYDIACRGLDWAIRNLLVPYGTSVNYVFGMVFNGCPSIQALGN